MGNSMVGWVLSLLRFLSIWIVGQAILLLLAQRDVYPHVWLAKVLGLIPTPDTFSPAALLLTGVGAFLATVLWEMLGIRSLADVRAKSSSLYASGASAWKWARSWRVRSPIVKRGAPAPAAGATAATRPNRDSAPAQRERSAASSLPDKADEVTPYTEGKKDDLLGSATLLWDADAKSLTVADSEGLKQIVVEGQFSFSSAITFLDFESSRVVAASFDDRVGPFDVRVSANDIVVGGYGEIIENTRSLVRVRLKMAPLHVLRPAEPQSATIRLYFYRRLFRE